MIGFNTSASEQLSLNSAFNVRFSLNETVEISFETPNSITLIYNYERNYMHWCGIGKGGLKRKTIKQISLKVSNDLSTYPESDYE